MHYNAVHALTVDAYALQHPGNASPQTVQSEAVHLISLYLMLAQGLPVEKAAAAKRAAKERLRKEFVWLDPPANRGELTVVDIDRAADAREHTERVERWARSVWEAWRPHHQTVRNWASGT